MAPRGSTSALCAAAVACLVLTHISARVTDKREPFGLEESVSGEFSAEEFDAEWINGTALLYEKDGEVVITDVSTNVTSVLVPTEIFEHYGPNATMLSADERFVLLAYDLQKVFRHSPVGRYIVYNMEENTTTEIGDGEYLQLAEWAPEGSALAYVYENNIYYLSEPGADPVQITSDGVPGVIYNGVADELADGSLSLEDSLGMDAALWWSTDGTKLAYARYDDTPMHNASFMLYGMPGALEDQYAEVVTFRYAKAGTPKAIEQLKLATLPAEDSPSVTIQQLLAPTDIVGEDHELDSVGWPGPNNLLALWTNRVSNVTQYVNYITTDDTEHMQGIKGLKLEQKNGWLDPQAVVFKDGNETTYVTIAWEPQKGNAGSFPHIVAVTGFSRTALTSGQITVTEIYGWADNGTLYYQATEENQPSRRQVYAVEERGAPRCLSCNIVSPEGNACRYAFASFSADFSWYALTCSGPDPTVISLHSTAEPEGSAWVWQDNADLREKLLSKQLPQQLDDWLEVGDGFRAQVRLLLPPGLDPTGSEKRPAVVYVYGGPNSQQVDDSYSVDFQSYLVTSRRYVYVLIDGRGSDCKGSRTLFAVYHKLGSVEVQDMINVTRQLKDKYPFIDGARTAIWGWSYGGYATAMALAQDDDNVFQCGVSVAPVTSWIYYDAKYVEQYMGLPADNEAGYNASDVTRLAARFANKTFFLVHGTSDDNVHYQHSMMLARALEEKGVLFRQQSYPDQDHAIVDLSDHLYRSMDEFFEECFSKQTPPVSSAMRIVGSLLAMTPFAKYLL